ncbi:Tyrocidine synthase 3 (Tyrocidine synthase III) [Includes: ATP-dependent asparagine adenylase (AsnA) (Asparagine activase) [Durusdinium trenchii]
MLLADLPVSPACRHLVLTGEPLPMELCNRLQSHHRQLRNHYGQTEAADTTTVFVVGAGSGAPRGASVPLGQPATQRQVWLTNGNGKLCDSAELGELLVGGPGLHLDQTMEESLLGAGPVLHTGDLARWVSLNGSMELICLGRKDRQVKVRGHRLELLEIEAVMKQEAESLNLQVEALVTLDIRKKLVAYVRPPLSAHQVEMLLKGCQQKLLAHAMPVDVVGVDEWPRTSSGKVDRKALPAPETTAPTEDSPAKAAPIDASVYLRRSPLAPDKIREKGWQLLRGLLLGLVTSRGSAWRMLLLPLVWSSWQQLLVPRHRGSLFAQDLSGRMPSICTNLLLALLPWRFFLAAAFFGAWRLGVRSVGRSLMWWMGLSGLERQVRQDLEWYSWYLRPDRSLQLARMAFTGCKELLRRLSVGRLPAKRPLDWDWDVPQRRPRRRPRLDYVWVDIETQLPHQAPKVQVPSPELSYRELRLFERLEEEAGVRLDARMPLSTAFDSLRLTALVGALRRAVAPRLTLREALACDTVWDLLKLTIRRSEAPTDAEDQGLKQAREGGMEPCYFRVREWPYMFAMSVCWALESQGPCGQKECAAIERALQKLVDRHGALSMRLADPPATWDLAMEAAANLSLTRAILGDRTREIRGRVCRRGREISGLGRIMDFIGWLLWTAWPRLQHERHLPGGPGGGPDRATESVQLDVVHCEDSEQLEGRSAWLLDGRNGRQILQAPIHAVLLKDSSRSRLHVAVSHGLADGFSGLPLLKDFIRFYKQICESGEVSEEEDAFDRFSGLSSQEARLKGALMVSAAATEVADIASWALPFSSYEGFDHFIWLQQASMETLRSIVEHRHWCCSLDVAVLALLGCALARLHPPSLHLRFVASARDQGDEGSVADFADARDLDVAFDDAIGLEEAARCLADGVRHRHWRVPDPRTSSEDRIYINVRPLLEVNSSSTDESDWHHVTQWPPVEGERNWDRRNVNHALWIMADQVSLLEWVFCLKIRASRKEDRSLGRVLEQVLKDIVLRPDVPLHRKEQRLGHMLESTFCHTLCTICTLGKREAHTCCHVKGPQVHCPGSLNQICELQKSCLNC